MTAICWVSRGSLTVLYSTPQFCLATSQCCTAAAMTKLNIRNVNFHCDSLAILWGRKTRLLQVYTYKTCSEARLLQDTQDVRTANDRARTHAFCPQMQHNRAATLRFIARLPQESYETVWIPMKFARLSSRRTCDSFATLQAHLATALRVNARQACEHRTDALRLV